MPGWAVAQEIRDDLLPQFRLLSACIDLYQSTENPSVLMKQNIILAVRGNRRIMGGPKTISKKRSPLDELYTESLNLTRLTIDNRPFFYQTRLE